MNDTDAENICDLLDSLFNAVRQSDTDEKDVEYFERKVKDAKALLTE